MLTPEEQAVRQVAQYGLGPAEPVLMPPNSSLPPEREGIWSALRLYDFTPPPKWYEMPGGGGVWVHPLSEEEITWLNLQASREARSIKLQEDQEQDRPALQAARARVWQVILAARQGEEEGSPQVLRPEDAPALRRNRGWWQAVRNICRLCDSIGSDEAALLEVMRDFFGELGAGLLDLSSSSSNEAGESASHKGLTALGSLVSSIRRRGRLSQTDLSALRAILEASKREIPTSAPCSDPGLPGERLPQAAPSEPAGVG